MMIDSQISGNPIFRQTHKELLSTSFEFHRSVLNACNSFKDPVPKPLIIAKGHQDGVRSTGRLSGLKTFGIGNLELAQDEARMLVNDKIDQNCIIWWNCGINMFSFPCFQPHYMFNFADAWPFVPRLAANDSKFSMELGGESSWYHINCWLCEYLNIYIYL